MSDGELKKRLDQIHYLYLTDNTNMVDILNEVKNEIPHTHPCYSTDEFDTMDRKYRQDVLNFFKKWFG